MKIAICDDCYSDILYLKELIRQSRAHSPELEFFEYQSGEALLEDFEVFDAIFLDMQLCGGMDGIQTAEEIRKRDSEVLLSFCSGFTRPANEVLQVQPYRYLIKNQDKEELVSTIEAVLKEVERKKDKGKIWGIYNGNTYILQLSDVIYISILNKGSEIWLTANKAKEILGKDVNAKDMVLRSSVKVEEYYEVLHPRGFARANKSYIINIEHIKRREKGSVLLSDGTILNVTRSMKKSFDDSLSKYLGSWTQREG